MMFDKTKVKIGIAPLTWTNDDLPELGGDIPFEQCIREMAETGYEGCEVGNKFPTDASVLKKALSPFNLQIANKWFSSYFSADEKQAESLEAFQVHAEFLSNMGAKVAGVAECVRCIQQSDQPILQDKPVLNNHEWTQLVDGLHKAGEIAQSFGLSLVYHYHMGTVIQTHNEISELMRLTDPSLVSLILDTGHTYFAGDSNIDVIKNFGDRIKHVHLKDIRANILHAVKNKQLSFLQAVKEGVFTVPGDGCIDFNAILKALSDIAYEGWLVVEAEQDPNYAHPRQYAQKGRDTIRTLVGI